MYSSLVRLTECCRLENFAVIMSRSGSDSDNFDEDQGAESFTIQPYQFEPRINSDEAESHISEGLSSDESSGDETGNPRMQNSDWYVVIRYSFY